MSLFNMPNMYVNGGKNSVKIMKRALNNLGSQLKVSFSVKGNFINEVNDQDAKTLHEEFKKERIKFYKNLVNKKPK